MPLDINLADKRLYQYPASIQEVDQLTGEEFERFIFNYLKDFQGYTGYLTETEDYGVDIILWKEDNSMNRFGVQCKRYGPKTILGENELIKMQKAVKHYGLKNPETDKPNLILFTSAEKNQISKRGLVYIENEEISAYYREDIINIIKDLDEKLSRNKVESNYKNIAFETSKNKKGTFKEDTQFVAMLKKERINIAKYNKISPLYLVYNDKTIQEIIMNKPITVNELEKIKGFSKANADLFGKYLIDKIRAFLDKEPLETVPPKKEVNKEEFTLFLKEQRKKIASYNNIKELYNVFNNKTLDEIVDKLPKTESELVNITGIGEKKVELWGSYLIKEINKFLDN